MPRAAPYTWDDFVRLDDDDRRELIDGELVEVEVPTRMHEFVVAQLCYLLNAWAPARRAGVALASGYKVKITARSGVMPDVQYFTTAHYHAARSQEEGLAEGHPDVVVEIISPSSRRYDRVTKLAWYASIGTPEYWIVDPAARTVERLVLKGERYLIAQTASEGDVLRPEGFEGLEIPLAELWDIPADWLDEPDADRP